MPSLEELAAQLIAELELCDARISFADVPLARNLALTFAQSVRIEALREAAGAEPFGDFVDAGGWHAGYRAGVTSKTTAIRALIDAPPSAPPADVTRALARLFRMLTELADDEDGAPGWVCDFMRECGLREWMSAESGTSRLTALGVAAWSLVKDE